MKWKVYTDDWAGNKDWYKVKRLKRDRKFRGKVSVMFVNSVGDMEKKLVEEGSLKEV